MYRKVIELYSSRILFTLASAPETCRFIARFRVAERTAARYLSDPIDFLACSIPGHAPGPAVPALLNFPLPGHGSAAEQGESRRIGTFNGQKRRFPCVHCKLRRLNSPWSRSENSEAPKFPGKFSFIFRRSCDKSVTRELFSHTAFLRDQKFISSSVSECGGGDCSRIRISSPTYN